MLAIETCVVDRTGLSDEQYIETLQTIVGILDDQTSELLDQNAIIARALADIIAEIECYTPEENTESSDYIFNKAATALEEIGYEV